MNIMNIFESPPKKCNTKNCWVASEERNSGHFHSAATNFLQNANKIRFNEKFHLKKVERVL